MRAAGALEPWNDELEQLLDRAADVLGEGLAHPAASVAGLTGPLGHEGIDVARQVRQRPGALQAGELPEGDQQRDPPQHAPGAVAPFRPARSRTARSAGRSTTARIRSTVCGLTKYFSSIGQLPLCTVRLRKHHLSAASVMWPVSARPDARCADQGLASLLRAT